MRTGNGDALPQTHQLGQHFGTGDYGNITAAGFNKLWIFIVDGGGLHKNLNIPHVFRCMAHCNVCAKVAQMTHNGRITHVRAGNFVALIEKNLGAPPMPTI